MSLSVYLLVAVPALVAVVVLWLAVRWWTRREPPADDRLSLWDETVELPVWSTLPEPDPDGWSSHVNWSAWTAWLEARSEGRHLYWTERMTQGLDEAPIFAALAGGPRELTAS